MHNPEYLKLLPREPSTDSISKAPIKKENNLQAIPTAQADGRKIAGLDGLRAVAILAVVLYHMFPHLVPGGFLGVCLFFVLSGFLMAVISGTAWRCRKFTLTSFYYKRVLRIYPPLLLTVCATAFFLVLLAPPSLRGFRRELFSILSGTNNWWQIAQNASYFTSITNTSPLTHLWSLAIEMQYYVIWPFLFFLCMAVRHRYGRHGAIWVLMVPALCSMLAMILLYQSPADVSRVYYGTDTRLFALLMGSALGLVYAPNRAKHPKQSAKPWLFAFFVLTMAVTAILFFRSNGQEPFTYRAVLPLSGLLFTGLVALTANPRLPFGRWLDCRPLSWIGARSYEIYLCQYPIIFFVQRSRAGHSPIIAALMELALILCFSAWLHHLTAHFNKKKKARLHGEKAKPQKMEHSLPPDGGDLCDGWRIRSADRPG